MLKNMVCYNILIDGKMGAFYIESDTSTYVAKEMVFQFQKIIGQIEDASREAVEKSKDTEEKKE